MAESCPDEALQRLKEDVASAIKEMAEPKSLSPEEALERIRKRGNSPDPSPIEVAEPKLLSPEEALQRLREQVTCSICLGSYTEPKGLQCFHVFCQACLKGLIKKNHPSAEFSITCPLCRQETSLPGGSAVELKSAFNIVNLLEIEGGLSKIENDISKIDSGLNASEGCPSDAALKESEKTKPVGKPCTYHEKEASLFCDSCNDFICLECTIEKHNGHQYNLIDVAKERSKEELMGILQLAQVESVSLERSIVKFEEREARISAQEAEIEFQIHEIASNLQRELEKKKTKLITQLQELSRAKLHAVNCEKAEMEMCHMRIKGSVDYLLQVINSEKAEEIILEKEGSKKLVKLALSESQQANRDPREKANMILTTAMDPALRGIETSAAIKTYFEEPQKCYATGTGLSEAVVGETQTITVYVVDSRGRPCKDGCDNKIKFEIVSAITENKVSGCAKQKKEHQYEISYQAECKGLNYLSIVIDKEHIEGSPFKISVRPAGTYKSLGTLIGSFCFQYPCGITHSNDGDLLVVSDREDGISVLQEKGGLLDTIRSSNSFMDVAIGTDQHLYVVDCANNQVLQFSPQGIITAPHSQECQLDFSNPVGIAFSHRAKKVYVTDSYNHQIKVLNTDLSLYKVFGKRGSLKTQFKFPWGICCDSSGKVYVADSENDRVQVFTAEGKFVRMFGKSGEAPGELKWPLGIAVDASNLLYVSESGNHRVSVFGVSGQFLHCFGEVRTPRGVSVNSNTGVVCVCDYENSNILIY